ncbi:hypothetical protein R1sor_022968 [Riccia sorocarpa]|uniref:CST complex subunit STN1 n=1 Tax=Riccia sorocarpa TaxID=122646 RepID=A0ABD3GLD0_9MARC
METRADGTGSSSASASVDPLSMTVMRLLAFDLLSIQQHPGPQGGQSKNLLMCLFISDFWAYAKILPVTLDFVFTGTSVVHSGAGVFRRNGRPVKKVEILGLVVSVNRRDSYVSFKVDDGTGCVPCILWTNHYKSSYFAHWRRDELELQAGIAESGAKKVKLGCLLRVMGRLSGFRNQLQITVLSLHEENDPNAEVFHWLQCMRLALQFYDSSSPPLT